MAYLTSERTKHYYAEDHLLTHPLVSPLFAQSIPDKPLPPILLQVGEAERLRDESIKFASQSSFQENVTLEIYEDQVIFTLFFYSSLFYYYYCYYYFLVFIYFSNLSPWWDD